MYISKILLVLFVVLIPFQSRGEATENTYVSNRQPLETNILRKVIIGVGAGIGIPRSSYSKTFISPITGSGPSIPLYGEVGFITAYKLNKRYAIGLDIFYNGCNFFYPTIWFNALEPEVRFRIYSEKDDFLTFTFLGIKLGYLLQGSLYKTVNSNSFDGEQFSFSTKKFLDRLIVGFSIGFNKTFEFGLGIQYGARIRITNVAIEGEGRNFLYEIDMFHISLNYDFL